MIIVVINGHFCHERCSFPPPKPPDKKNSRRVANTGRPRIDGGGQTFNLNPQPKLSTSNT